MSDPMIVIATQRGYYGDKTRYEGERFAITSRAHFSDRWMVDPNGSDYTTAHKQLEQTFNAARAKPNTRTITDEQLIAEVTQSSGVIAGLRAENLNLKEKISALQGQLDQLLAKGPAGAEPARASRRAAAPVEADRAEPAEALEHGDAEGVEAGAGAVDAGAEAGVRRVRRTS